MLKNKYIANSYNSDIILNTHIQKQKIILHFLGNSFVTHHLEDGVDLRYIQELLGYKSSKMIEIYTHVSRRDIGRIKSLLDLAQGSKSSCFTYRYKQTNCFGYFMLCEIVAEGELLEKNWIKSTKNGR